MNARIGLRRVAQTAALGAQRLMLRTERTRLRTVWAHAHELAIRVVGRKFGRHASVYAKGSFGFGDPVYGISDIDLVIVVPTNGDSITDSRAVESVKRRWQRVIRLVPQLRELFHVFVYDSRSLSEVISAPFFTFGLDQDPPRAAFLGPRPLEDEMGLQERPELFGATREWRLVGGRSIEVSPPPDVIAYRRIASWLELQFWWRYVFTACVDPRGPRLPYLCVKLVAEPARIWLWLVHGERFFSRVDALNRALQLLPEEADAFRGALELQRALPTSPRPPLNDVLPQLVRLSSLIAGELVRQVEAAGTTEIRLFGATGPMMTDRGQSSLGVKEALPLVDWRARAVPPLPDEVFTLIDGDPGDPAAIARVAARGRPGAYQAFRAENLLILPATRVEGRSHDIDPEQGGARFHSVKLRGIQCPPSDPVSFALADGQGTASFPNVPGWSARDCAVRAVAEHAAWIAAGRTDGNVRGWVSAQSMSAPPSAVALGRLFTAARAALFLESFSSEPELPLTVDAVARRLADRDSAELVEAAVANYAAWRGGDGDPPTPQLVEAFAAHVARLPAYKQAGVERTTAT